MLNIVIERKWAYVPERFIMVIDIARHLQGDNRVSDAVDIEGAGVAS